MVENEEKRLMPIDFLKAAIVVFVSFGCMALFFYKILE